MIRWRIIAMFLPSFFIGQLIQRFGVLTDHRNWNFLAASVLVGLGWKFAYVGGS